MTNATTRLLILCAVLGAAAGCRTPHLGDEYGKAHREAFHVQAVRKTATAPAPRDARDAEKVMRAHRGQQRGGAAPQQGGFVLQPLQLGTP